MCCCPAPQDLAAAREAASKAEAAAEKLGAENSALQKELVEAQEAAREASKGERLPAFLCPAGKNCFVFCSHCGVLCPWKDERGGWSGGRLRAAGPLGGRAGKACGGVLPLLKALWSAKGGSSGKAAGGLCRRAPGGSGRPWHTLEPPTPL